MFVGLLVRLLRPLSDELEERDVDEVIVEVRVRAGVILLACVSAGASRRTLRVDELRVGRRDRLRREKEARGARMGA
jgi:hypothetical protein